VVATPVREHTGRVVPVRRTDIDTDLIIPAEFCKRLTRTGYADGLFAGWRAAADYPLARPEYAGASILVAGARFGIGSSREHAVWALVDHGIRVVVAPSFGDIFRANAAQNQLLTAQVPAPVVESLWALAAAEPGRAVTVDLVTCQIRAGDLVAGFEIGGHARRRLLSGLAAIDETLQATDAINAYERRRPKWMPTVPVPNRSGP
jgi:3-isopropylmalate/(R)-2-methylmalate dehydratase small subunit